MGFQGSFASRCLSPVDRRVGPGILQPGVDGGGGLESYLRGKAQATPAAGKLDLQLHQARIASGQKRMVMEWPAKATEHLERACVHLPR
mmetsp:Transcript_2878/g.13453  ORF Transcript_2878/g.13453 Transcript_2878/m.13453 type:complete len:89 (-) Transcript_2878:3880-4146(-)